MLRFPEEIMLLLLDEEQGQFSIGDREAVRLALAGGVLMDLALESRIDTDLSKLMLLDAEPTGDSLLDPVLADIAADDEPHDARYWVDRTRYRADEIGSATIARLIERRLLFRRSGRFLRPAPLRQPPMVDDAANREVKRRIADLVFGTEIPEPRDVVLICLCDVCGLFGNFLAPDELGRTYPRIDQIGKLDLIGQAVMALLRQGRSESGERLQALICQGLAVRRT